MKFRLRNNFHGTNKNSSFFEGWYLKHQSTLNTIAFIPAFHIDNIGRSSSSIQVIMNNQSFSIDFPEDSFTADKKKFYVKIRHYGTLSLLPYYAMQPWYFKPIP